MKPHGKVKYIQFAQDYLEDLLNNDNSCVTLKRRNQHLSLHPYHLNDLNNSLKDILNEKVGKHIKELDGILLAYQNIKVLECDAPIYDDSCFAHINIQADFYVFKPEINKVLHGSVVKKFKDVYIGCLLYQIFNVSLPKSESSDDWIGSEVQIGHEISFKITYLNLESLIPYIRAQPIAITGGAPINISFNNIKKENRITKFDNEYEGTHNYTNYGELNLNYKTESIINMKEDNNLSSSEIDTKKLISAEIKHETSLQSNDSITKKKKGKRKRSENNEETNERKDVYIEAATSEDIADIPKKKRKKSSKTSTDTVDYSIQLATNHNTSHYQLTQLKTEKREEEEKQDEEEKPDVHVTKRKKHKKKLSKEIDTSNIKQECFDTFATNEIEKSPKKKRKSNSNSIEDIESMLLEETLNNLKTNGKSKKSKKSNELNSEENGNVKKKKSNVKKEKDDVKNDTSESTLTEIDISKLTNALLLETLACSTKRKPRKTKTIIESMSSQIEGKSEMKKEKKQKKKKKELKETVEATSSSILSTSLMLNGSIDSERKAKSKKKSKRKSMDDLDALTAQLLNETLHKI